MRNGRPTGNACVRPLEPSHDFAGCTHFDAGIDDGKRVYQTPSAYSGAPFTNEARLINFFTITDIHISDEETPSTAMFCGYKGGNSSAYSPVMMLTTQVLDAAVQTVNALHKVTPFDFGLSIGDVTNGSQYNELRWYIDVLDGQVITPDSGDKDDPVAGPSNDYQDSYQAAGLDPSIPWYQTLGNHDHMWLGSYPMIDYLRQSYTGTEILRFGDLFVDGIDSRRAFMGAVDGRTPYGDLIGVGPVEDFMVDDVVTTPTVLAADPDRRPVSKNEWMSEFFNSTSEPKGHGFSQANLTNDSASYSFVPKDGLPLKVIVLDDTQQDEGYGMYEQGYVNQDRLDWLVGELDAGQAAGQLMILSTHVPVDIVGITHTTNSVSSTTLLTTLSAYPNLLMCVSGHRHRNMVRACPSIDPAYTGAEYGFWLVETASLRDFPQQFRTFDILRNSDDTISIKITDVDPAVREGSLAAQSRSFAVASASLFKQKTVYPPSDGYNAELIKQLSPEMRTKIHSLGTSLMTPCELSEFHVE